MVGDCYRGDENLGSRSGGIALETCAGMHLQEGDDEGAQNKW